MSMSLKNSGASVRRGNFAMVALLWVVVSGCIVGCAVGPDFARPQAPLNQHYSNEILSSDTVAAQGRAQHFKFDAQIAAQWWKLFDCEKLNWLITGSLDKNPSLQAAQANLRQSQDVLRAGYGIFYPQIGAGFEPTRQQFSPARFGEAGGPTIFNLYTFSTSASYLLDVFGGERRTIEGLGAQAEMQYYNAQGSYLALTGNIVNAVVAEAAYSAEIDATGQMVGFLEEQTEITGARARAGVVPYSDLLSIQTQLAAAQATLPPLRQQLSHTKNVIAILAGVAPADWGAPRVELSELKLPSDLPVSLPSDLVRQRPDILAAEAQLHTASAQIGVATAALFPCFTLNADYGWNSTSLNTLFAANAAFWTMGASLATPLLQGPTLWFQRKAAIDAYQQALANYRQTVLAGLAQVADALDALRHDAQIVDAESTALRDSSEALNLVQASYRAGTVNYLQVLIADAQYQQTQLGYIQAVGQRLQDTAALFVALGGGWWNAPAAALRESSVVTPK